MGGAAAVIGAIRGIAKLGPKVNVVCVLALAENAIGPDAYKPHSIIQSMKGLTVEVGNTGKCSRQEKEPTTMKKHAWN